MAGTNHQNSPGTTAPQPTVVLVAPQMGENIGASARAMWNFGLDRLRLVAPRDGWPNPKASAVASGAGRLLDEAQVFAQTQAACSDLTFVFATTARDRALTKRVLTPERAMTEARQMASAGEKVGVLFGPERAGLDTADIVRANAVVSVPVNPAFGSLNLAQCVLLVAYEWSRGEAAPLSDGQNLESLASGGIVGDFVDRLVDRLDAAGFFYPTEKRARMLARLENLFRRTPLTKSDVQMLHGVVRALSEKPPARAEPPL